MWRKFGRHVRRGEKGINIFAPVLRQKKDSENGTQENLEDTVLGYRPCTVFDVSQTEGKPLPTIGRVRGDARHHGEKLVAYTLSLGIRLEYSPAIAPARHFGRREDHPAAGLGFGGKRGGPRTRTGA